MDVSHNAGTLERGRESSAIVLIVSLVLTVIIGVRLW